MVLINEAKVNNYVSQLNLPPSEKPEIISEGIKYFKASKRLYKLAQKITTRAKQRNNSDLINLANKVNLLAKLFEEAEDDYEAGNKANALKTYNALKQKYSDILKLLKQESIKNALKGIGSLALVVAGMTIPYLAMNKFFPNFLSVSGNGRTFSEKTEYYLKRAGAFTICGIPTRALTKGFNSSIESMDDKIIKSVDRLLNT